MSRTLKDNKKIKHKRAETHKANPYGICRCRMCSAVRKGARGKNSQVKKIKIKLRKGKIDKGYYFA